MAINRLRLNPAQWHLVCERWPDLAARVAAIRNHLNRLDEDERVAMLATYERMGGPRVYNPDEQLLRAVAVFRLLQQLNLPREVPGLPKLPADPPPPSSEPSPASPSGRRWPRFLKT